MSRHPAATTRSLILDEAVRCFAEWGYEGTSLNDIAAGVGIRRPSLLHHFPSKELLYQEAFERLLSDWLERVESAAAVDRRGWEKVEAVLRAGFDYFAENPDYVRLVRRAAIDGGNHLVIDLAGVLRPMFDRAAEYFEREMAGGTFLRHDARHLMISGYGALLSYFSDSALLEGLLDNDPFSGDELERRADHVIELFASALGVHRER